jgi:hypothetical protein
MHSDVSASASADVAFYTVADSRHFVGLVGLINSLRLVGHHEKVVVVDVGMTPSQRSIVQSVGIVVDPPKLVHGVLAKPVGPLSEPADVMVLLDADVLAVKHLTNLIDHARNGELVFFENDHSRFFEEWSDLGLGELKREPYVIAGHFLGPRSLLTPLFEVLDALQDELPPGSTHYDGGRTSSPFYFADQDLINAYLMSVPEPESVIRLSKALSPIPPFSGIRRIGDIHCVGPAGLEPYFLHHILNKPWLRPTRRNVYVDVLQAALWAPDAAIRLEPRDVPPRLRPSWQGRLGEALVWPPYLVSSARERLAPRRRLKLAKRRLGLDTGD